MTESPKRRADLSAADASRSTKPVRPAGPPSAETARAADSVPMVVGPFTDLPMRFGRYKILKELGRGQMGAVYLAQDTELDRPVALKVARTSLSGSAKLLKRMEVEAKAAAKIDHPLICKVYDAGEIDGIRFIALQYIEGEDLKQLMKRLGRRREPAQAIRLVLQILRALAAAHEKGVIHRDLKPENVMLNKKNEPVIMDFGLARRAIASSDAGLTQGMVVGTAAYMSPEQATGKADAIDHRSDLYAVGAMLFEMLTGEWPFTGGAIEVMGKKCCQEPPTPLSLNPNLHPQLAAVCHKMIAKQKEDRYATCAEIISALQAIDFDVTPPTTPQLQSIEPVFHFDFEQAAPNTSAIRAASKSIRKKSSRSIEKKPISSATSSGFISSMMKYWNGQSSALRWTAIGSLGAFLFLLGAIVFFPTSYGTVQVEIDDEELMVKFDGKSITVNNDGQPIKVTPTAEHTLEVLQNGVAIETATRRLTLKKGEKKLFKISLIEGDVAINGEAIVQKVVPKAAHETREENASLSRAIARQTFDRSAVVLAGGAKELPLNQTINLMEMVKFPDHAVLGNWKRVNNVISCEPFRAMTRFMVPLALTGSYQFNCRFMRHGYNHVGFVFPVGDTSCFVSFDGEGGSHGLKLVDGRKQKDLVGPTAGSTHEFIIVSEKMHEFQLTVTQRGPHAEIKVLMDGEHVVSWEGNVARLSSPPGTILSSPNAIGVNNWWSTLEVYDLTLRLGDDARGFQLGDDWKNPLSVVADQPPQEVAEKCLDWGGKKYFVSGKPMSLWDARLFATRLNGRLLMFSSKDEEEYIAKNAPGLSLWLAAWRPPLESLGWRDERNRPLRYLGKWALSQPDHLDNVEWNLAFSASDGWSDVKVASEGIHACIEWGEEYADISTVASVDKTSNEEPELKRADSPPKSVANEDADWATVFNGKNLIGWTQTATSGPNNDIQVLAPGGWIVRNGELTCNTDHPGWLRLDQSYSDCEFEFEFFLPPGANSGLLLRHQGQGKVMGKNAYEIQLENDPSQKEPEQKCGAIYGIVAPWKPAFKSEAWNQMTVRLQSGQITVRLNDQLVVDTKTANHEELRDFPKTGHFALLNWNGKVGRAKGSKFRNIRIKELE